MRTLLPFTLIATVIALLSLAVLGHRPDGFLMNAPPPSLQSLAHAVTVLGVGAWGIRLGGRAVWALPVVFAVGAVPGLVFGLDAIPLPSVWMMLWTSVLALSVAVGLSVRMTLNESMSVVGFFGVFHGNALGLGLGL